MNRRPDVKVRGKLTFEALEDRLVPSISPTTLPVPTVGNAYAVSITDVGAVGSYTLTETGSLPAGLTFNGGTIGSSVSHVQDAGYAHTSSDTSLSTGTFAKKPTNGDALVVWAWGWAGSAVSSSQLSCSDTGGNAYTQYAFVDGGSANGNWSCLFIATNITGAASFQDTVKLTGAANGNISVVASEFSGVQGLDVSATNSGTTAAPSANITTTNANDLLVSVMACNNTVNPATVTTPSNWTQTAVETNGRNYEVGQAIYRIVSSATTYTAQWNSIGTTSWGTGIIALKGAAGSGSISGTPTTAGTSTFTITGTDSAGNTSSQQYTVTVNPAIVVTPTSLAAGTINTAYSATFSASGGSGSSYTFSESGALPAGLTFSSGTLSGTPTQSGSFSITVTATDSNGATGSVTDTLTINSASSLTLSPSSLQNATANTPYSVTISATGGSGSYSYAVTSGSLASWLTLNSRSGLLSGTPSTTGSSSFTITATDNHSSGLTGSQAYTLTVNAASSLTVSPATMPSGTVNTTYSVTVSATGGSGTYAYAVTAGTLPSGLSLNTTTGVLSGTPTATGTSSFTITATDSTISGLTGNQAYTLTVNASGTRPQPTTLNTASSQYQNLAAVFPLWVTSSTANTTDYGPHALSGAPTNVQVHTDPTMGNVFYAGSSASNFQVPYNTYLDFAYPNDTAQAFSLSCWINTSIPSTQLSTANNPPNMYMLTFDANDGASFPGYGFGVAATLANNGPIVAEFDVDGHEAQASMFGKTVINDGNWHLIVATYTPSSSTQYPTSTGMIYIDGNLDATSHTMAELESPKVDPPGELKNPLAMYIGTDDDGHSSPWQGMFCDLRFYNGALSVSQISAMYALSTRWELYTPSHTVQRLLAQLGDSPGGGKNPIFSPGLLSVRELLATQDKSSMGSQTPLVTNALASAQAEVLFLRRSCVRDARNTHALDLYMQLWTKTLRDDSERSSAKRPYVDVLGSTRFLLWRFNGWHEQSTQDAQSR
jgi:hypothetical protein